MLLFLYYCFGERKGERHERETTDRWAPRCAPTWDPACNLGVCSDWESNRRPFGARDNAPTSWATLARACAKHLRQFCSFWNAINVWETNLNEPLVLQIKEDSCAQKQSDVELRVGWAMGGRVGILPLFLYFHSGLFYYFLFITCIQQFDCYVPPCSYFSAWGSLSFLNLWAF